VAASSRPIMMALVALLALGLTATLVVTSTTQEGAQGQAQPEQVVIRGQLIRRGPIAIYIHSFPYSYEAAQIEYYSPVVVSLSVWGVSHEEPIRIYCDGREVAAIEEPGYYTIQLNLPKGYHHVAITCRYGIFASSTFYVKPPETRPAPEAIPLPEVQAMLEALRREVWRNCLIAACAGVVAGYGLKRASKIEFYQLYAPLAIPIIIGLTPYTFTILYWLVPFGLTAILAYHFVRDFAEWRGYICFQADQSGGRASGDVFPLSGDKYIAGLRPLKDIILGRGLLILKRLVVHEPATIELEFAGMTYTLYVLRSPEDLQETEDALVLKCDRHLARALVRADILKLLDKELADLRLEVMAHREMARYAALRITAIIDEVFATSFLHRLTFRDVERIRQQLRERILAELGELAQPGQVATSPGPGGAGAQARAPQAGEGVVEHGSSEEG